jgi:hypothetical protein
MGGAPREAQARTRYRLPDDPYNGGSGEKPPPRLRRPLIVVACLIALIAAIALAGRIEHHNGSNANASNTPGNTGATGQSSTAATAPAVVSSVPVQSGSRSATIAGLTIPIGYPDTTAGAESAAANYASAYGSSQMVVPTQRDQILSVISDPAITSSLETSYDGVYAQVDRAMGLSSDGTPPTGESYMAREVPIGVSVGSESSAKAVIAVWAVTFAGVAGSSSSYPVTQNWTTDTITLNWADGDWKMDSVSSVDGPSPNQGDQTPSTGQQLQQANNQYGGLPYAG